MASETQILANRPNAQVMVLSFLRMQESRVLGVLGFRIKCGMTAQNVPTKSCALCKTKPILKQKFTRQRRDRKQNTEDSNIMAKDEPNVFYICRESSTNRPYFMQNKANFRKSQMNVNLYNTTDYENKSNWTPGENKPNSKPIKANLIFTAENTEHAEKKDISVSYCSIERYALYHISPRSLRTRRLMKNKANQSQF